MEIPPNSPEAIAPVAFSRDDSSGEVFPEHLQLWLSGAVTDEWIIERAGMSTLQWYMAVKRNGGDSMLPHGSGTQQPDMEGVQDGRSNGGLEEMETAEVSEATNDPVIAQVETSGTQACTQ